MNTKLTNRSICAIALGGWAAVASALSLGPVSGTTVVGRPLELVAPIQFDELAQGNGSGCVTAEVLYGDKVVDRARVELDLNADATRQVSYARISSAIPVDEPFVTVVLHAGCGRQSTRRYVLLAEAPRDEPMALAAASTLGAPKGAQLAAVAAAPILQPRAVPPVASTRLAGSVRAPRPAPIQRVAAPSLEAAPRSVARLQLALWDPSSEQLPWLRTSTELKSSPTADAARRAAATSLWRALNAQPQDLLRTAERLRGLEEEISSLQGLSARHRAEISSARDSLQSAQSQRHTSLLLVTLVALLAGSGAAFFWHRSRRPAATAADSWYAPLEPWGDADVVEMERKPAPTDAIAPAADPSPEVKPPPAEAAKEPEPPAPLQPVAPAPVLAALAFTLPEVAPASASRVHSPERPGLRVDALHGAQQQSEFFASLGQIDEAVAVLRAYLEESGERPVLAFLELFHIYHGTGMRGEYEELQSTFRRTFGIDVAGFGEYRDEPRELDLYLLPVTRIASAWPSVRSQEIIEELLFKRPATPRDLLSLEAYRELVWLYALGQEVIHNTGMPAGLQLLGDRGLPNNHFILPWADAEQEGPTELSLDRLDRIDVAPELNAFAVDIDLTAMRGDNRCGNDAVHVPQLEPARAPAAPPETDFEAFDAVMELEAHRHFR